MSFLTGLSNAVTAASDVAGGYAKGQQKVDADRRAQALLMIKQKRQDEQDAIMNALHKAQTRSANATADQGPAVTYQPDDQGNIVALPTHLPKTVSPEGQARPTQTIPEGPTTRADSGPKTADTEAPSPVPTAAAPIKAGGDTTTVTPPAQPKIGTPTGIKGPPKAPVPGSPEWKAQKIAEAKIAAQYGYHPGPTNVYLPSVNKETGETEYTVVPNKGPVNPQSTGLIKPQTGGGNMSGQTLMAMQRLGFTKNDLDQSIKEMEAFENNPENLKRLSTSMQALGAVGEVTPSHDAHGILGALNNGGGAMIAAGAQQKLAHDFPELAQYLYNKQRVGTAFTEVLPRPNQQLLGIEKGLSGIDVGWTPAKLADVQARRRGGQEMLNKLLETTPIGQAVTKAIGAPTAKTSGPPKGDPTAGMSDADAWEYYVNHGMGKKEATVAVSKRRR